MLLLLRKKQKSVLWPRAALVKEAARHRRVKKNKNRSEKKRLPCSKRACPPGPRPRQSPPAARRNVAVRIFWRLLGRRKAWRRPPRLCEWARGRGFLPVMRRAERERAERIIMADAAGATKRRPGAWTQPRSGSPMKILLWNFLTIRRQKPGVAFAHRTAACRASCGRPRRSARGTTRR